MQQPQLAPQARAGGSSAMYVAIGCGLILLLMFCMGGVAGGIWWFLKRGEPPEPATTGPGATGAIVVSGVVTSSSGLTGVASGTPCSFTVEHRESGMCRASVICGGTTVYGSTSENGFFPCSSFSMSPPSVVGADGNTTASDQDPAFSIDTNLGTFSVSDDATGTLGAFSVTARISSVN